MGKHAYLIMDSGNNFEQLQILIDTLDDKRNDIFIHIDKKSQKEIPKFFTKNSHLHVLNTRISVYWGDISIVKCELLLFETAFRYDKYEYYHLLSGQDLPLHSQNYIHDFFDKHAGQEFISFDFFRTTNDEMIINRFKHYHLNTKYSFKSSKNKLSSVFIRAYRIIENNIQSLFNINRENKLNIKYFYGSQWVSIDNDLVAYILNNKVKILSILYKTNISDELFIQTVVWNNPYFRNKVFKKNKYLGSNLRYINWKYGLPYVWKMEHFDLLRSAMEDGFLFSRKFDLSIDTNVIKKILIHNSKER